MSEEQQKKEQLKDNGERSKSEDDVIIDFSALGNKLKSWWKKEAKTEEHHSHAEHHTKRHSPHHQEEKNSPVAHQETHQKSDDEIHLDWNKLKAFWNTHSRWLIPLLCILLAMSVSIYLRTMPLRLPIADNWAENTVTNFYQNQLQDQIRQQYPNLPEQNQQALLTKEWLTFAQQNKQQMETQIAQLSQQYKNGFRDEQGVTYLLGIDPYYYYRQTGLILKNGFPGTEIRDSQPWDSYRLAPLGREQEWNFHIVSGAAIHWIINWFMNAPLMQTFFFVGTIFSALTVIPAFFIGRILTRNNVGGFFTAMLLAISAFFVARTTGESSDTDVHSVFFPVLITWFFLEALEAEQLKKKMFWIMLAGLATGLFAFAWTGWWYIATFIMATFAVHLISLAFQHRTTWKATGVLVLRRTLYLLSAYLATSAVFISVFTSFHQFVRVLLGPFQFLRLKAVAVTSYWPNIRTTVAELNVPSFGHVIDQFDGKLYFTLAIMGIILCFFRPLLARKEDKITAETEQNKHNKQNKPKIDPVTFFFFALWFVSAFWATTKGVRFILQLTPVFSIGLGAFLGLAWHSVSHWTSKELHLPQKVAAVVIFLLLGLLLISPMKSGYSQAFNSVSSVNDGWYNVLTKIKMEAPENVIITSWWDFGHWFKALAERPVTFDGGTQLGYGAHWVGKSLLANDERVTVGIIRMLNCGQNSAFEELDKALNDTIKAVDLINEIIVQDKATAIQTLRDQGLTTEQIASVIRYTHCDAPTDYYITSEDMVGKAGVWGHFGSWNFKKAVMHKETRNLNPEPARQYLMNTFNLSREEAEKIHTEVVSTDADRWISPWPGYLSGWNPCQQTAESEVRCIGSVQGQQFALRIDLSSYNTVFEGNSAITPNTIVYATKEGIAEKQLDGQKTGFSIILVPDGDQYQFMMADPLQANSMFTKLFFMEGHGQKCFQKFDDVNQGGFRIITWIVDYSCQQENKVYFLPREQVRASHILISRQKHGEAEALALAESLRQNVTTENFAEYATQYSEDPGSQQNGGDLGWFKKGQMVPEFEQVAFSLRPGQISEPVKTQFGYHLIYAREKKNE